MFLDLVAPLSEFDIGGGYVVEQSVIAYIKDASDETNIDFDYLLAKAYQESGFSSHALADTTSAVGMFQFTEETWLSEMRKHGKKYGYGFLTEQIKVTKRGYSYVSDKLVKKAILDLRLEAKVASIMAAEYAKENKAYLSSISDRKITSSDLYIAHFLGPRAAAILISAEKNKNLNNMPSTKLFPEAARANKSVFYKKKGVPYTVAELRNNIEGQFLKGVKRFSDLPEEVLASLPKVSIKKYADLSLCAPIKDKAEEKIDDISKNTGYALDEVDIFSNYAYLDNDDFDEYAEGYNIDYKQHNFDYATLSSEGISRISTKVVP